jgi:hypothetical protein
MSELPHANSWQQRPGWRTLPALRWGDENMTINTYFEKVEAKRDRRISMNNSPRMKLLTLCIGAALVQMASLSAHADSGVGVDTVIGNAANPGYAANSPVLRDADAAAPKRTPSGQLYSFPPVLDGVEKGQASAHVDIGATYDSDANKYSKKNEYKDTKTNGVSVNNFGVSQESADGHFFSLNGGAPGQNDQFFEATTGKYNGWKVKAFYNETPHVFTETWKSLFTGEGSGNLAISGLSSFPQLVIDGLARTANVAGTPGTPNYIGPTIAAGAGCTAAAPCWLYNGKTYNVGVSGSVTAVANNLAAILGVTGTPDMYSGLIPTGPLGGTTSGNAAINGTNGANNAVQSGMAAALAAKLANIPYSELSLDRKKAGVRGDLTLSNTLSAYAGYSNEHRVGARPFSVNENNFSVDVAEPIDYDTHDFLAGLTFRDGLTQANLLATASVFRNNISTLVVQYPLMQSAAAQGVINHTTLALAPSNEAFNIKGDFARSLPDLLKGKFTASASYTVNKQNADLLAPIAAAENADLAASGVTSLNVGPGITASAANPGYTTAMLVSNWNTTAALSRQTAGQEIDKKMINLGLLVHPTEALSLKGDYRHFETENKGGGYIAYNPLTGQLGRGISQNQGVATFEAYVLPGTSGGCYAPAGFAQAAGCLYANNPSITKAGSAPTIAPAYATKQNNFVLTADYDLSRASSLNASVDHEVIDRNYRERDKTTENKLKLGYTNRELGNTTLRVSLENDSKHGSAYIYNAHNLYNYGNALPGGTVADQAATVAAYMLANPAATQATAGLVAVQTAAYANVATLYNFYSSYFRKADLADRDQQILNTRVNYQPREDLDIGANLQAKRAKFAEDGMMYGIKNDDQDSLTVDFNYQPSSSRTITGYYSYQDNKKSLAMNAGGGIGTVCNGLNNLGQIINTAAISGTTGAGTGVSSAAGTVQSASSCADWDPVTGLGPRPLYTAFTENTHDINNTVGLGLQQDVGFGVLSVDYNYGRNVTKINYTNIGSQATTQNALVNAPTLLNAFTNYSPKGGVADQQAYAAAAGNALPDMTTETNTLTISLSKPIDKKTTVRASYRFEGMRITDWHYDGVIKNVVSAMDGQTLLLDSGPQGYHVNTFGVSLKYKL